MKLLDILAKLGLRHRRVGVDLLGEVAVIHSHVVVDDLWNARNDLGVHGEWLVRRTNGRKRRI